MDKFKATNPEDVPLGQYIGDGGVHYVVFAFQTAQSVNARFYYIDGHSVARNHPAFALGGGLIGGINGGVDASEGDVGLGF